MVLLPDILKLRFMEAIWRLYIGQRLAYVIQVLSRFAVSMLQCLVTSIRGLDSAFKIGYQAVACLLCRISIAS